MKLRLLQNFGLKRKAFVIFLLLVIFPTLGVGVFVQTQFKDILREQYVNATIRNLDSVAGQLEEQTALVEDIANYLIFSPALNTYLRPGAREYTDATERAKDDVEGFLTFHLMSKSYIRSVDIRGYNGNSISIGEPIMAAEEPWLQAAAKRRGGIVWSEGYSTQSGWSREIHVVSLFRVLNAYPNITNPQGDLIIRMDQAQIGRLLQNQVYREGGSVHVLNREGHYVLQSEVEAPPGFEPHEVLAQMKQAGIRFATVEADGKPYLTFTRTMDMTGWTIITAVPESYVNAQSAGVRMVMTLILAVVLLLGVLALFGFHYTIIRPIMRLKNETNRVKLGDYSAQLPVDSHDEISDLNRKFNEMVLTIKELIEHKYKQELRERESELRLLQQQMDPHFLYNTLDMIRWTARLEKAGKTSHLIETLSRFFRSSLGGGQYMSTVGQELEFVQSYLYLQQRRLGERFQYSLYMEYNIAEVPMLKTTIQPLVENYIKHGVSRKSAHNVIAVRCYAVADEVWIDVRDNGPGIPAEKLEAIQAMLEGKPYVSQERSGAIRNIHERLSIYFGEGYGLSVVSSTPAGTVLRLVIPKTSRREGEEHEQLAEAAGPSDPDADRGR
ncbi:cache domain-containing sensor histidine kinase [Paenibacillus sp. 1P07SE]|uniref:cache domain-containing sensor histidine kinase n=1 Tax=Paenibacillus sp. 1P07SE TaxID=3132209 RepID=UPI0039A7079C